VALKNYLEDQERQVQQIPPAVRDPPSQPLPDARSVICVESGVDRRHRQSFFDGLSYQKAVERIAMMERKLHDPHHMPEFDG
jgi:hypothetical protein